ncbi:hypothetical protein AHMF7605_21330 [Adhaeribacter arboris]|uniref:Aerotolerance regulator N-terminal domain-containing protein n=1 Tax=Adhaeribacter arboris TaxID=2072846 RepID=A0A2T2YK31_9BACT|nr:hypothetical protein [Adhaeribacter arboris]PSR55860.1 hypothetical protein AHMF7605_21330 [Adhaeribacter arboris]
MKDILIFAGAILLLVPLLGLAWKRPNRRFLFFRILANAGAVLSLFFIARPAYRTLRVNATEAILLTPGYPLDSLKKILKEFRRKPPIFSYDTAATGYQSITNVAEIRQHYPRVKRLHVLGYGLDEIDLKPQDSIRLVPHLNAFPIGVISLDWTKQLTLGEKLTLTGRYHQTTKRTTWLYLTVAGKTQDSIQIKNTGVNRFSVTYLPKQIGQYVYALHCKSGNKRSFVGELPIEVKPKQKLRILLLPASPSFEIKFLKNYLAAEQHGVALRLPVSKDIFQTEWLNMPKVPLQPLNAVLWQQFDLLITDVSTIQTLSASQQQALTQAVQQAGLGVIIVPEALPLHSAPALLKNFSFVRSPLAKPELNTTPVFWPDYTHSVTSTSLPYFIKLTPDLKQLVWDAAENALVATKRTGWGKVTVSLLPQTYTWPLASNKSAYTHFWSFLLSQTSKSLVTDHTWHVAAAPFPLANQVLTLYLSDYTYSKNKSFPKGMVHAVSQQPDTVYLAQQTLLPHRFTGSFWPRNSGWHEINKPQASPQLFYVFADSSFIAWRFAARLTATRNFVKTNLNKSLADTSFTGKQPIPAIYFFLTLLVCAGFLWLEEKW